LHETAPGLQLLKVLLGSRKVDITQISVCVTKSRFVRTNYMYMRCYLLQLIIVSQRSSSNLAIYCSS